MKLYTAEVLADSIAPNGARLTSVAWCYPHAVHKDNLRHRNQSRVVESFRARPTELLIEALRGGAAFKPEEFAHRVAGMTQGEAIEDQEKANLIWDHHVEHCLATAEEMGKLDIAKQQRNFVLQDLCPLVEIVTATDWSNFAALRTELKDDGTPVARPEVHKAATALMSVIGQSTPEEVSEGMWHVPLMDPDEIMELVETHGWEYVAYVSAGRCARVSYDKHRESEPWDASVARAKKLLSGGHMSPFECVARPLTDLDLNIERGSLLKKVLIPGDLAYEAAMNPHTGWSDEDLSRIQCGNFNGWVQLRKTIPNEHDYGLLRAAA